MKQLTSRFFREPVGYRYVEVVVSSSSRERSIGSRQIHG